MPVAKSLRRVLHIALAEGWRTGGSFNKKTTALLFAIGLATAFLLPPLMDDGLDFDRGIYRAAVSPDAALLPAIESSRLFRLVPASDPIAAVQNGEADIGVTPTSVYTLDDSKGESALAALKQAAKDYTFTRLLDELAQGAAFPVRVELRYAQQERNPQQAGSTGGAALSPEPSNPSPASPGATEGGTVSGGTPANGAAGEPAPVQGGSTSGFAFLPPERSVNTPETLSPPFPFRSLLLAYMFLIPMNFVVQVYAGSAISERLGRKGEALLASPARPWEIILGKALPYFLLMMGMGAVIVLFIGGSWLSLVAIAPLAATFIAMEFVAAMFARSFRELTFLTVFSSVLLTIYSFLPAVFSDVHPVALVSPITLVVFDLRDQAITVGQLLYATLPLTLFSGVLFTLGAALYHEEDLFHQKPIMAKAVDAVGRQVRGLWSAIKVPILLIPLVLVAELLLMTFLFAWPVPVGTLGILLAVALVEEAFKGVPSYAAQKRKLVSPKRAVLFGALVGLGFWIAEKGFLLISLVGLMDVPAGAAVFGVSGAIAPASAGWGTVAALLLAPLALHIVTASISGWGARQGGRIFALSFTLAVAIHTAYNFIVVTIMGAGVNA